MTVSYPCCWLTMLQTISPKRQVLHFYNMASMASMTFYGHLGKLLGDNCWQLAVVSLINMSIWHLNDILGLSYISIDRLDPWYGGFLKWWYPTTIGFPTKNDHFGVFWGYHHSRKHPYRDSESFLLFPVFFEDSRKSRQVKVLSCTHLDRDTETSPQQEQSRTTHHISVIIPHPKEKGLEVFFNWAIA